MPLPGMQLPRYPKMIVQSTKGRWLHTQALTLRHTSQEASIRKAVMCPNEGLHILEECCLWACQWRSFVRILLIPYSVLWIRSEPKESILRLYCCRLRQISAHILCKGQRIPERFRRDRLMQNNDGHAAPQHSHHYMDGSYPPRPAAGICCRSFCYACFLSCTSLLLCLTRISRFAGFTYKRAQNLWIRSYFISMTVFYWQLTRHGI